MNKESEEILNIGKKILPNIYWFNSKYTILSYGNQDYIHSELLMNKGYNTFKEYHNNPFMTNKDRFPKGLPYIQYEFNSEFSRLDLIVLKSGLYMYKLIGNSNNNVINNKPLSAKSMLYNAEQIEKPTAIGLDFEGFILIYSVLIKEIAYMLIALMRILDLNNEKKFKNFKSIRKLFIGTKKTVTYKEGIKHLLKITSRLLDVKKYRSFIFNMEKLEGDILSSDICDFRFGFDKENNFSILEKEINNIFLEEIINKLTFLVSIKEASEITKINENTIKKFCQNGELLNIKKVSKTWLVDCDEIKKYWQYKKEYKIVKKAVNTTLRQRKKENLHKNNKEE